MNEMTPPQDMAVDNLDSPEDPSPEVPASCSGSCPCQAPAELVAGSVAAELEPMVDVVGCRSRRSGPVDFFQADGMDLAVGDKVMVETEAGAVLAEVLMTRRMVPSRVPVGEFGPLVPVLGKATQADIVKAGENEKLAAEAKTHCQECIRSRKLDMKLVDVEVAHDRSKMAFYFTAPARIDFRELVKDLVRKYRTRIELRQIGVRHETQMVGAIGNCGMVCCCRRYLRKFAPVAIKMAKEQNVFLNPAKISGICGRLLCCLAYEQENYDEFYRRCPKLGKKYQTTRGVVRVLRASMFRESVNVLTEMNEELEFTLEEWQTLEPTRPEGGVPPSAQQVPPQSARPERERGQGRERAPRPQRPERDGDAAPSEEAQEQRSSQPDPRNGRAAPRPQNRHEQRPPRQREERVDRTAPDRSSPDQPSPPRPQGDGTNRNRPQPDRRQTAPAKPAVRPQEANAPGGNGDDDTGDGSIFGLTPRRRSEERPGANSGGSGKGDTE